MDLELIKKVLLLMFLVPLLAQASSDPYQQLIQQSDREGVEWEFFPKRSDHHYSFGLSTELKNEEGTEFYAGPLASVYHEHLKYFLTAGVQGREMSWRLKSRFGVGHEFMISDHMFVVPNLTADYVDNEIHPGVSLGLAHEF